MIPRLTRLAALWRNLTGRAAVERDLDDEVRSTLAMLVDEKLRAGSSREAAKRPARLELGGVESLKDQIRDVKAGAFADVLTQDLRFAVRLLRRNRLFTLTATVSLAIGIGPNATIFSIANALFFRAPAGVTDPDRIVDIGVSRNSNQGFNPGSYPDFLDIRQHATMLDGVYAASLFGKRMGLQTTDRGLAAPIFVSSVTANFFAVLGAHSSAGRLFEESDATTPEVTPLVLSHSFWTRFFSRDRAVIGRTLQLDGRPFVVVGVAAERFQGIRIVAPDAWLPISTVSDNPNESATMTNRNASWLAMGARLRREASLAQAAAELDAIGRVLQREHPDENRGKNLRVKATSRLPGGDVPVAVFLALMMGVVTLVLAVACANVAGVLLARAASRRQEIAVRLAMGASRVRLARQLLTETVMLFACGAGAGLLLAVVLTRVFVSLLPALPFPVDLSMPLDGRVVAVATGLSLTAALFSGLAPALQSSRTDVAGVLKSAGPMLAGRSRLRSAFVVAQLASSIVLVVSAGLFVRALQRAGALSPGFESQGVELATVDFTIAGFSDATAPVFARELATRVGALPSV